MNDQIQRLRDINEKRAATELAELKHAESQLVASQTQEVIVESFQSLVQYLDKKVTKTEVINQLTEIGTPDAAHVVLAVNELHETLKTHENTDLTEVTKVMQALLDEAKQIPKVLPEQKDQPFVDYTKQFSALSDAMRAVEKVVKEQELVAEAPVINLPETNVHVDAPDLKPLQDSIKAVVTAVKKIVIPEYKTDNTAVEKLLKKSNDLLGSILDKPVGGGGGGGRVSPYEDSAHMPSFVTLRDGNIPVVEGLYTERYDYDDSTTIYTAQAVVGTSEGSLGWTITKFDLTDTNNASGKIATDVSWTSRASGTYS